MEFQILHTKELEEYIYSDEFNSSKHIAISKLRGISHLNNPRKENDDSLLIVVKKGQ